MRLTEFYPYLSQLWSTSGARRQAGRGKSLTYRRTPRPQPASRPSGPLISVFSVLRKLARYSKHRLICRCTLCYKHFYVPIDGICKHLTVVGLLIKWFYDLSDYKLFSQLHCTLFLLLHQWLNSVLWARFIRIYWSNSQTAIRLVR